MQPQVLLGAAWRCLVLLGAAVAARAARAAGGPAAAVVAIPGMKQKP